MAFLGEATERMNNARYDSKVSKILSDIVYNAAAAAARRVGK